ncbi:HMG box family protein [Trichomonas vaginalis G3]|uniref:HMG box family protein n=1 Tax=Trichomonas vaginalis (strain ATCC PRA-98 / G3) TaxID=412133 RepID=A2FWL1_TRIV3|nr:HMG-box family [Trichomonas vaginalis G3]EAX90721.1 HMG box family protein [Trichomonas vaginalis G3]KAI5507464.1 HMG-box family [Trichomonas vaginalis G3]|eukprot:XP_001303651.1 HMG box family protein [Trichomonas vaginalis G3]
MLQGGTQTFYSILPPSDYSSFLHHLRMEPFQIFCHEKRAEVSRNNPQLSSSKITSLLGTMWRSLKPYEKQSYIDVALSMKPNDTEEVCKDEIYQKQFSNTTLSRREDGPRKKCEIPLELIPNNLIPKIQVIARSGKWKNISNLSQTILYSEVPSSSEDSSQ